MSGKSGLIIGLLVGVILAIAGSLTTVMLVGGEMDRKQAEAYDRGFSDAMDNLKSDSETISSGFNQVMLQENKHLQESIDSTRTRLQGVMARDDLPQSAKDELANIVNDLPSDE